MTGDGGGHCEAGGVEQIQDDIYSPVMLVINEGSTLWK